MNIMLYKSRYKE